MSVVLNEIIFFQPSTTFTSQSPAHVIDVDISTLVRLHYYTNKGVLVLKNDPKKTT